MPDPTREQFDAASKKVMATAPAGLSREDFYALIDKELSSPPSASAYEMATHTGKMAPPDDSGPSLIKGLVSMGSGMAHPGVDTKTGQSKSLIDSLGDFAGLLIPSALGTTAAEAAERYYQGTKAAVRETKSVKDAATLPMRAYRNVKDALPSVSDAESEKFLNRGPKPTPTQPTFTSGAGDIVDRHMPPVKKLQAPAPPPAKPPTLDEALQSALEESMQSNDPAKASTLSADTPVAGMQKGKVGKRPGGYTTDLPPITEARQNELLDRGSTEVGGQPASLESAGSASPAGGDVAPVPNTKPKLSAEEVAAVGRRMYGSRDAGAMLYGNSLSPAERAEAIKRMAPGPSRLPLTAEARINGQPRDLSLEEALKNLIIESKGKP